MKSSSQSVILAFILLGFITLSFGAAIGADLPVVSYANSWTYGSGGSIIGIIVLILDVLVFNEVLKSNRPTSHKFLWCVVVFLFPIFGLVIYWLFSDRDAHFHGGYQTIL
ncbi:hypothetical protein GcM1_05320 [Golovinomyces cichoracearum]|uniref:Cardiolipin synthase N-terminal domain-containing protein n=1 Tax=Golovinomyces cichoracearum TaxID=62708 RepID=A0A420J0T6_9PEZI|nr:hypothetical protein GcM1_05320 [Golovinomyces cichoracearum]